MSEKHLTIVGRPTIMSNMVGCPTINISKLKEIFMKAVITKEYGSVDVLKIVDVEKPIINDDEILVEVKSASINPLDWRIRTGEMKIMTGKIPPRILGSDYSGIVVEIGKNISSCKKGDEVFGMIDIIKKKEGTYAEFLKVRENDICLKPDNLNFEEAASLPLVALTTYKALVDIANVKKNSTVLINGCTGGVGSAAVQIAKALELNTTGICSTQNVGFAKEIGCDDVVDYKKDNVLEKDISYDVIFDTVGNLKFSESKKILKAGGIYVTTAATVSAMILSPVANMFRSKKLKIVIVAPDSNALSIIRDMAENKKVKAHIFKTFSIEQIKEAHEMSQKGGFRGKLALKIK